MECACKENVCTCCGKEYSCTGGKCDCDCGCTCDCATPAVLAETAESLGEALPQNTPLGQGISSAIWNILIWIL